jgi:hypothetical protein
VFHQAAFRLTEQAKGVYFCKAWFSDGNVLIGLIELNARVEVAPHAEIQSCSSRVKNMWALEILNGSLKAVKAGLVVASSSEELER